MFSKTYEKIRYQSRFVVHISRRDLPKRLASTFLVCGIMLWLGEWRSAALIGGAILFFEACGLTLHLTMPARDALVSPGRVLVIWLVNWTSIGAFIAPAFVFTGQGSVAMLLAGYLWLFGIFVHISNTFAALPFFNWSLMIPSFSAAFVVYYLSAGMVYAQASPWQWLVTAGMMVVYIFNTVETLSKQKDTAHALERAREEANARLRALEHLSLHDSLTGLLNRRAFDIELGRMLAAPQPGGQTAVFLMDLDGFKPINDTYSHEAGDHVLVEIGRRLRRIAGTRGIAARLGGDEFALAFPGVEGSGAALRLAERVARAMQAPVHYLDRALQVSASVGISLGQDGKLGVEALCAQADQAMFKAKSESGGHAALYEPGRFVPRPSLEDRTAILDAMTRGQIRPFYQPKVCLETGRIAGFEALARWLHPIRGQLSPGDFLPQVNELGLQGEFLSHITGRVLRDVAALMAEGLDPGQVSINVPEVALATRSGRSDLEALIARYPQVRGHVTFEITEDVFIARAAEMIQSSIAHFRALGLRISLDDFGTGFASFQHLRQLEFDELKIDTTFVAGLGLDPAADVLVAGFLSIGTGLGVRVVAEGVETDDQLRQLRRMGCTVGQGFLFGAAMPLADARTRLLAEGARLPAPVHGAGPPGAAA
ncbi:MAG: EAL domain-containing protein [Limimaricola sp.]|uniref:putative bifunctional diguanylate cyclase/phosphodiesterase n=1 Tax=Limimaricola sp. TaxID=2211665 RepID=UPI001E046ED4|nr:EAL domain-containing protein [Limimaricola sp.]MBI1415953.1 EAL domain-containing protein [Limimaricola sp.]